MLLKKGWKNVNYIKDLLFKKAKLLKLAFQCLINNMNIRTCFTKMNRRWLWMIRDIVKNLNKQGWQQPYLQKLRIIEIKFLKNTERPME